MRVYLLRHGRTLWNDQRRYLGLTDLPLTEEGRSELRAADFTAEIVYTSPLLRARQTARILFPNTRIETVADFREMDFGDFEGRSADQMADDPAYRAWVAGLCEGPCPNGESRAEFCARTCRAFSDLVEGAAAEGKDRLVIVAHSGTLRAVMERFSLPAYGYFDHIPPNGGGYVLDYDPALWMKERRLRLVGPVCCARGAAPC